MKVWITRPKCDEVYMGGFRYVMVWVEKPVFDQRPCILDFELYDPVADKYVAGIYRERGWWSQSGGVQAKRFLKQDLDIREKVWAKIYESVVPADCPDPLNKEFSEDEYRKLLDVSHEAICSTHWKRFLLEIDIRASTVELIAPKVIMGDSSEVVGFDVPASVATSSHFIDEDLERPYRHEDFSNLEHCVERIF